MAPVFVLIDDMFQCDEHIDCMSESVDELQFHRCVIAFPVQ